MRIVDIELAEALKELSNESLEIFKEMNWLALQKLGLGAVASHSTTQNTKELKQLVDAARKREGLSAYENGLDDIEASKTSILERDLVKDGIMHRQMSKAEIRDLAKEIITLRKGEAYQQSLKGKNFRELSKVHAELARYNGDTQQIDKYGVDFYDKSKILGYLLRKQALKEMVSKIKPKDFEAKKQEFEDSVNSLAKGDSSSADVHRESILKRLFDEEELSEYSMLNGYEMTMADIAQVFEERQKEMATSKKGMWGKIKEFFTRKKNKRLPEYTTREEADASNIKVKEKKDAFRKNYGDGKIEVNYQNMGEETQRRERKKEEDGR